MSTAVKAVKKRRQREPEFDKVSWKKDIKRNWVLYIIFIPAAVYFIVFHYLPMFGIIMAFEDFKVSKGFFGSEWVGFKNFMELFSGETFSLVMRNTIAMAVLNLTIGFICPIVLALILSETKVVKFRRVASVFSYIPYFVAAMVVAQLAKEFLAKDGAITLLLSFLGLEKQNWLANSNIPVFWIINLCIDIWVGAGFGSKIYVASISTVSGDLHEAAAIDGAGRWRRLVSITLPGILPIIVMMFTLKIGLVFVTGFDKILLMYMPTTYETADVLSTYTYRMAFGGTPNYGLSAASGLFQSVVGTILLFISNWLNKKATNQSLF